MEHEDDLDLTIDEEPTEPTETEETEETEEPTETEETEEPTETEETDSAATSDVLEGIAALADGIRELRDIMVSIKDGFGILVENGATVKEPEEVLPPNEGEEFDDIDGYENVLALDELDLDM